MMRISPPEDERADEVEARDLEELADAVADLANAMEMDPTDIVGPLVDLLRRRAIIERLRESLGIRAAHG